MRNEMQQLLQLSKLLEQTTDPEERERIKEDIFNLEMEMEEYDDYEYKSNHYYKESEF